MRQRTLVAVTLLIVTGCATKSWVEQRVLASEQQNQASNQVSEEQLRQEITTNQIDPLQGRIEEVVNDLDERLAALPRTYVSHQELTPLSEHITRVAEETEQNVRTQYAELNSRLNELSDALAQRNDLQERLVSAVDELNQARADFAQHRATVDNRVSKMEAEAKDLLAALTELDERIQEFFYNEFKNLQRKRESLLAEVDLIDRLVSFLAQREPISLLDTEGEIAGANKPEDGSKHESAGKQNGTDAEKPGGG